MREDPNSGPNGPAVFDAMPEAERACLLLWIELAIQPAKTIGRRDSYTLKHAFEHMGGFYVTNGEFKGAMRHAGYEPVDAAELNWRFRVKPRRRRTGSYYGYRNHLQYAGYGLDQLTPEQQRAYAKAWQATKGGESALHGEYAHVALVSYPWMRGELSGAAVGEERRG